jgi:hypothetical protein
MKYDFHELSCLRDIRFWLSSDGNTAGGLEVIRTRKKSSILGVRRSMTKVVAIKGGRSSLQRGHSEVDLNAWLVAISRRGGSAKHRDWKSGWSPLSMADLIET